MKRLFALLTVVVLLAGILPLSVSAESCATRVDINATVTPDGDCFVAMTVLLRMDSSYQKMSFPLPVNAKGISVNGNSASTTKTESSVDVDISRFTKDYVGELSLRFEYTLSNVVKAVDVLNSSGNPTGERVLQLQLPMLNGFRFPVEKLSFVVNLPAGTLTHKPDFTSTYRQASFGSDLEVLPPNGNQYIGSTKVTLSDYESVMMTMYVPQEMFPSVSTFLRTGNPELMPMLICAGVAVLYWLLFLRTKPMIPTKTSTPPEGITAGELGSRLTMAGVDLTTMVFSWAQMGYLLISLDGDGRVLLHKRMDMGNERSQVENKIFKALFGKRRVVDATGHTYAKLCARVKKIVPNERNMHKISSGSKKIYRMLCCGSMVFCGICIAANFTSHAVLQTLLSIILGFLGAVFGWIITGMAERTHLRGKVPVLIGLTCMVIWIVFGLLCGQVLIPLGCAAGECLLGFLSAYGGRRSELGRHDAAQVLGLRHYLKHLSKDEISRLLRNDPEFYFHMAPHALALGIINPFSRRFGDRKLSQCPYIVTRVSGKRTADEWGILFGQIADMMDARERRMQIERWLAVPTRIQPPKRRPARR